MNTLRMWRMMWVGTSRNFARTENHMVFCSHHQKARHKSSSSTCLSAHRAHLLDKFLFTLEIAELILDLSSIN